MLRSFLIALLMLPGLAWAAPAQTTVNVGASVKRSCAITHVSNLNFGKYDPIVNATIDLTPTIGVRCTAGSTGVKLVLGPGQNAWNPFSCAFPRRHMIGSNGGLLRYYFFTTYTAGQNLSYWGCAPGYPPQPGDSMTEILPEFTTQNNAQTIVIHARVYNGQNVKAGTYQDSVNVGLVF